jgi:hypothetical protein
VSTRVTLRICFAGPGVSDKFRFPNDQQEKKMSLKIFLRLWFASMLLFLLMNGAPGGAQSNAPAPSVTVYQAWG